MPYRYSQVATDALADAQKCITDRRADPVRNRNTMFRLMQQNMLAYTYDDHVPGFARSGVINSRSFSELLQQPTVNARAEGTARFGVDFLLTTQQVAKVEGDIFEQLDGAVLWNTAAMWNTYMVTGDWPGGLRYPRPAATLRRLERQIAVLALPRHFDWVRLLTPDAHRAVERVRAGLRRMDLLLPTSTPDIMVVALPEEFRQGPGALRYQTMLPDLRAPAQAILMTAYEEMCGRIEAGEFVLAIAVKKSLRSDRLYQPLYEANVMQLLLEGRLGAPQVDFEVHTIESAGTGAADTYRAASLSAVATNHPNPHRAVRDLYQLTDAPSLVRRLLDFLTIRMAQIP